jgi:hypothetical protein
MGLLVASRPPRVWLALTENHAGQRLSVGPSQAPNHVAVAFAWVAQIVEPVDQTSCGNVTRKPPPLRPGRKPRPLRAAAHVFAVAEIPPPMIAQVEGGIFTPTSIPFGAVQRDRNQA